MRRGNRYISLSLLYRILVGFSGFYLMFLLSKWYSSFRPPTMVHGRRANFMNFEESSIIFPANIVGPVSALSWGDLTGDLHPDLFFVDDSTGTPYIFISDGKGSFLKQIGHLYDAKGNIISFIEGALSSSWADYNKDEYEDFLLSTNSRVDIYVNTYTENGRILKFRESLYDRDYQLENGGCSGPATWVDANNDNVLDVIVICQTPTYAKLPPPSNIIYPHPFIPYFQTQTPVGYDPKKIGEWTNPWGKDKMAWGLRKSSGMVEDFLPPQGVRITFIDSVFPYEKRVPHTQKVGDQKISETFPRLLIIGNYLKPVKIPMTLGKGPSTMIPFFARLCQFGGIFSPKFWHPLNFWARCENLDIEWSPKALRAVGLDPLRRWEIGQWSITDVAVDDLNGDLQPDIFMVGRFPYGRGIGSGEDGVTALILINLNDPKDESAVSQRWAPVFLTDPHTPVRGLVVTASIALCDFDNDMDLDAVMVLHFESGVARTLFYLNDGNGVFTLKGEKQVEAGIVLQGKPFVSASDFNEDGAIDVFHSYGIGKPTIFINRITSMIPSNDPHSLLSNNPSYNNWIEIDVFGQGTFDSHLLASRIYVITNGVSQVKKITAGSPTHNSNMRRLHFGVGSSNSVEQILIILGPSRSIWSITYRDMAVNKILRITGFGEGEFSPRLVNVMKNSYPFKDTSCALATHKRLQPSFIIIGVWKCGTTGLYYFLGANPNLLLPSTKELQFFKRRFSAGMGWYRSQFQCGDPKKQVTLEASPGYFNMLDVPQRIQDNLPDTRKFIICVRNPIERSYSHFRMIYRNRGPSSLITFYNEAMLGYKDGVLVDGGFRRGKVPKPIPKDVGDIMQIPELFDLIVREEIRNFTRCREFNPYLEDKDIAKKCLTSVGLGIVAPSMYAYFLDYWLQFFPIDSFLILHFSDIINPHTHPIVMKQVEEFATLPVFDYPPLSEDLSGGSSESNAMFPSTKKLLDEFFEGPNARFYDQVGRNFNWEQEIINDKDIYDE